MMTFFYISAAVALISSVLAISRSNAVHALLYAIVSLLSVALIFFMLGAPFAAALEVVIYAGAIMVLFVFVIMMISSGPGSTQQERRWMNFRLWIGPYMLGVELSSLLLTAGLVGAYHLGKRKDDAAQTEDVTIHD